MILRSGISAMSEGGPSSSSGVHFKTGILTEPFDADQLILSGTGLLKLFSLLGPTVPASLPHGAEAGLELVPRGAGAQRLSQISPVLGVEAQIPHAIGGQPAPVAGGTEGGRGRGNDAERRAIRQGESLRRRGAFFENRLNASVV